ncbi:GDSL-type esterase/lipase family protein [Candidatus Pacearchaeota archaeon]|jgi:lysophospholipase L1-like esterase|nr:GDSL-type esterase/lipase family protein [Candidatus Pacearchaeota archaeon]
MSLRRRREDPLDKIGQVKWPSGAVALYTNQRTSDGRLMDLSHNNNHIAIPSGASFVDGPWGKCLSISGQTLTVPNNAGLNPEQISILAIFNFSEIYPANIEFLAAKLSAEEPSQNVLFGLGGMANNQLLEGFAWTAGKELVGLIFGGAFVLDTWNMGLFTYNGTIGRLYLNNMQVASGSSQFSGNIRSNSNDITVFLGSNGYLAALILYPRALTSGEYASIYNQLFMGQTQATGANIIFEGDSLTWGHQSPDTTSYPETLMASYPGVYWCSMAQGGDLLAQMTLDGPAQVDPLLSGAARNVLVFLGGTNDLGGGGRSAAQVESDIEAYCLARKTAGWEIILCTIPNSLSFTDNLIVNQWLRAHYTDFADRLADIALIDELLDASDATHFIDGVHLTDAGYGLVASVIKTTLDGLLA